MQEEQWRGSEGRGVGLACPILHNTQRPHKAHSHLNAARTTQHTTTNIKTAWLSGIETVSSAGLPREYFDTPSKFVAYGFLAVAALLVVGFFAQH